ncbi:hypothetical protein GL658_00425 [Shigella sonnei]|nr:hypothetical protein [Shigella sonnei]
MTDNSTIAVDSARYIAGETVTVTVNLKDSGGNAVSGKADILTSNTVQVPNTVQAGKWADNGDGTYTAAYTAQTAGTGLKATLKLDESNRSAESGAYEIAVGAAVAEKSSISVNRALFVVGETMTVTVTLKDTGGNGVTGEADALTGTTVQVPNAVQAGKWADNGDGTYTAAYTAQTAGTGLKATLKLEGWITSVVGKISYMIDNAPLAVGIDRISVNGYKFDAEAGFPKTGFKGAEFTLQLSRNGDVSDYTWKSDASWVSVTDGVVKFTDQGNGNKVTITGTPKNGDEEAISFNFTLEAWFINNGTTTSGDSSSGDWSDAEAFCNQSGSGYNLPTVAQVTNADKERGNPTRAVGNLWSEWGDLTTYSSSGFGIRIYLTSERQESGVPYVVSSKTGYISKAYSNPYMMCRKSL